jgi:hypothetical protein
MICMDGSILRVLKLAFGLYHYPAGTTQACVFLCVRKGCHLLVKIGRD